MKNKQWYESIHRWDNVHEILSKCSIACTSWYAGTLLARQNWLNNFKCTKFLSHCLRVTPIKHKICVHCTPSNILKLFHIYIVHILANWPDFVGSHPIFQPFTRLFFMTRRVMLFTRFLSNNPKISRFPDLVRKLRCAFDFQLWTQAELGFT